MASAGYFDYIPVDDFLLLEFAFLTIAYKVTKSLSLSVNNLSIGDVSATWAEVQQHRQLSNVAIDYALLVDVSASMNDMLRPQCFEGHDLRMVKGEYRESQWFCDVCGKDGPSMVSLFPSFSHKSFSFFLISLTSLYYIFVDI